MPYKNYDDQRAYHKEWYKRNKQRLVQKAARNNKTYRQRNFEYILSVKSQPCKDCRNSFPHYVMDFDHTDDNKLHNIARFWRQGGSLEALKKEIAKCEVVCSNCHRVRTMQRLRASGGMVDTVGLNPITLEEIVSSSLT